MKCQSDNDNISGEKSSDSSDRSTSGSISAARTSSSDEKSDIGMSSNDESSEWEPNAKRINKNMKIKNKKDEIIKEIVPF